jgi:PAS domain S-box-containing protein
VGKIFAKLFQKNSIKPDKTASHFADLEAKSAIVIETISDGLATTDDKGIIQLFNPAAATILGCQVADAVDLDFRSVFKFFDATEHPLTDDKNPIILALKTNQAQSSRNLLLETKSGKHLPTSITITPIASAETASSPQTATSSGVVITFRDITAQQKEEHEQAEFISTASHEMRTPVAIIEGYLGMLMNPATATIDGRGLAYAQKAHQAAQHLGHLFQDLLDVTKADDQRTRLEPVLIDASAAARQIVDQFQSQAATKNLSLIYDDYASGQSTKTVQPLLIIYVDIDQLNEILGNLVENAIKYTKTGQIKVGVSDNQGRIRFSVTDTGIGIPAEDVPHLFQKFYRVDNSDTREIGGSGLGLYLIKKLTENMGGQVGLDSNFGVGSTFWVEFDRLNRDQAIIKAQEIKSRTNK